MTDDKNYAAVSVADEQAIRAMFLRQAAGEAAHDIQVIETVLARALPGQPDPVNFVARAYCFWGREAVIDHFRTIFAGTWRFEPDPSAIRVMPLGLDVAHSYAPTRITVGAAGHEPAAYTFLVNEIAIRTAEGWRISSIVPRAAAMTDSTGSSPRSMPPAARLPSARAGCRVARSRG